MTKARGFPSDEPTREEVLADRGLGFADTGDHLVHLVHVDPRIRKQHRQHG